MSSYWPENHRDADWCCNLCRPTRLKLLLSPSPAVLEQVRGALATVPRSASAPPSDSRQRRREAALAVQT